MLPTSAGWYDSSFQRASRKVLSDYINDSLLLAALCWFLGKNKLMKETFKYITHNKANFQRENSNYRTGENFTKLTEIENRLGYRLKKKKDEKRKRK